MSTAVHPAATPERAHPRALPARWLAVCAVLIGLGGVAFAVGLMTDPTTTWRAFHVNYLYFGTLAQAGVVLACAFVIVGARWTGPIRRIAEGLGVWTPITLLLFLLSWGLGNEAVYSAWLHHPPESKAAWLEPHFFFWRQLGILAVLTLLSLAFLYHSVRPTLAGVVAGATRGKRLFALCTAGWRGDDAERERSARRCGTLAPIICLSYAAGFTFVCFDQVMSLSPHWFSNLFGAYFAWGGFLSAVACTALIAVTLRRVPDFAGHITAKRMHDLGKMIFAFSIFWMYLFFSQYLVIWYGNLPEETSFFRERLGSQFLQDKSGFGELFTSQTFGSWDLFWERLREPYAKLSLATWCGCWIIPFWVLLGQRPKRNPIILGSVGAIVLIGFWLERNVLIWPSLVPGDTLAFAGWIQFGIAAGFLGAFALVYLAYATLFPSLALQQAPTVSAE